MVEMRDRLIELIADKWLSGIYDMADHLIANGVILPPCKVGQKVYDISEYILGVVAPKIYELKAEEMTIEKGMDNELNFVYDGMYINNEDIGETLFFTEKEAEAKLKEREGK